MNGANKIVRFLKDWALAEAMVMGIVGYLIYHYMPISADARGVVRETIDWLIPTMVFVMLFVTFCKVDLRHVRFTRWHLVLFLFQLVLMTIICVPIHFLANSAERVMLEAAFICVASPTATGSVVVLTSRFGGNTETTTAYTIISNLITAIFVPILLSFISDHGGGSVFENFLMILRRVTPLLVIPLALALLAQIFLPRVVARIVTYRNLPLYLWAVAMCLAIAMTVRFILLSDFPLMVEIGVALVSMIVCAVLFFFGKRLGGMYGERIGAGQGLAQRNTVFIIWLGSTFLSPTCAIAGGFYSIWQNSFNSYQMYRFSRDGKL